MVYRNPNLKIYQGASPTSGKYAIVKLNGIGNQGRVTDIIVWSGSEQYKVPDSVNYTSVQLTTGSGGFGDEYSTTSIGMFFNGDDITAGISRFTNDGYVFEDSLTALPTIFPGSVLIGNNPPVSNKGYNLQFADGTKQYTAAVPGVLSFNGLTGNVTGVSSVNGLTGAVSITYAATSTITSTNTASTTYPVLALGSGITGLYIDNATTPLAYIPSSGQLQVVQVNCSSGSNYIVSDSVVGTVEMSNGTDTITIDPTTLSHNPGSFTNYNIVSTYGVNIQGLFSVTDPTATYTYTFPQTNGSNGQVLTTNGAGTLSWSTVSGGSGSSTNSTTQIIDFSETTNELTFTISGLNTSNKIYSIDNIVGKTASLQNAAGTVVVSGTIQSAATYWDRTKVGDGTTGSFINPIGRKADIIISPPFTSGYTAGYLLGLNLTVFGDNNIYTRLLGSQIPGDGYTAGLTFGGGITYSLTGLTLSHTENTYVVKGVTGQSWVTANSFITCKCLGLTTADHTPEDAIIEGVRFEIDNIVAGVGFNIIGHAPEGTYGKYQIKCLGQ
jgi:hypothetical protein